MTTFLSKEYEFLGNWFFFGVFPFLLTFLKLVSLSWVRASTLNCPADFPEFIAGLAPWKFYHFTPWALPIHWTATWGRLLLVVQFWGFFPFWFLGLLPLRLLFLWVFSPIMAPAVPLGSSLRPLWTSFLALASADSQVVSPLGSLWIFLLVTSIVLQRENPLESL